MNFINIINIVNGQHLPIINRIAIVVIDFLVVALLLTVFDHNKFKDKKSQIFVFMGMFILLWVNFAYGARSIGIQNLAISEIALRIAWVATPFLFFFTYLTSVYVIGEEKKYMKLSLALFITTLILGGLTAFTGFVINGVKFAGADLDIVYGSGFLPFLFIIFLFMVFTLFPPLRIKLTNSSRNFLFGVILFYILNAIFNIVLPVFFGITHYYYIGDYSTVLLLSFTAFAILRNRLFNIRVATTEVLIVSIWIVLFSKIFFMQSFVEVLIDVFVFLIVVILGMLLIRSVIKEIEQREKLQELTHKLRVLDKQKDEFISMAAHELRAPMTAIKGYISMIMDGDAGKITKKARDYLVDVNAVNDRLVRLVNNMLNVSRIEEGRMIYNTDIISLSEVARAVYASFRFEAQRKGLQFVFEPVVDNHDMVQVDSDRLYEVVGNLVSNAVKYTEKGSIKLRVRKFGAEKVKLEVIDTGPGVSKLEQKKLFQKFYRVESVVGKTIGTGLGLYISKLLVNKFKGKIGIDSDVNRGSNFWFELPLCQEGKRTKSSKIN